MSGPAAGQYRYGIREYRIRYQLIAEMNTPRGGWVALPSDLTGQLLGKIETGGAVRDEKAT